MDGIITKSSAPGREGACSSGFCKTGRICADTIIHPPGSCAGARYIQRLQFKIQGKTAESAGIGYLENKTGPRIAKGAGLPNTQGPVSSSGLLGRSSPGA